MAKKKEKREDTFEKVVDLSQDSAKAALDGLVQTAELTENYVEGIYKLGYETNVEGLKIAGNYWDTASKIRNDWIKLFASAGEQVIDSASSFELPYQDQAVEFGKEMFENVEKTFSNLTGTAGSASK